VTGIEYKGKRIPCRLVIFDKDGTLVDFTATWVPLIRKRVDFLLKALGRNGELGATLLRYWGIDPVSGRIDSRGPCPVSPRSDEIIIGTTALYQRGYPWDESKQRVIQAFDQADAASDRKKMMRPIEGIQSLLHDLKHRGFSLALATSDERRDTEAVLSSLGLENAFDVVFCAEEINPPKPHPETIFTICRNLSILPRETIMIGDTVTDMVMGKRAAVALTVGILEGGVAPREELAKVADVVLDSIRDLNFYAT
jgi:phosphoglycolate phosphatase